MIGRRNCSTILAFWMDACNRRVHLAEAEPKCTALSCGWLRTGYGCIGYGCIGPHLRSPVSKHDKCHGDDHGLVARLDPSFMTWGSCYLLILTWLISVSVYDISHRFRIGSSSPFWNGVFDISAPFKNLMDLIGRDEQMLFDTDSRVIFSWELWEIQAQGPALWPSWGNRWYQASNLGQAIFRHIKLIGSSILMHFWVDSLKKSVVGLPNPWLTLQLRPKRCAARYKFWGSIIYLGKLQRPHCDLTGNDG